MALWLMLISLACFSFSIVYLLGKQLLRQQWQKMRRLEEVRKLSAGRQSKEVPSSSFSQQLIVTLKQRISNGMMHLMPVEFRKNMARRLVQAGQPLGLSVQGFLGLQGALLVFLPLLVSALGLLSGVPFSRMIVQIICCLLMGILFPQLLLTHGVNRRRLAIQRQLPDILDLITISIEAGLGFDGALSKVVEKTKGPLTDELQRVLKEIRMGKTRYEALRDMNSRNGVEDLTSFVGAVIQADQLGVSIGNIMRIQSDNMRKKRRQRAEEAGMKAPVKMLFPLVFFIFPAIFIVILGPAAIQIYEMFAK